MKHKLIKGFICTVFTFLIYCHSAMAANSIAIENITTDNNRISVCGILISEESQLISCLVTDESQKIVYVGQTKSNSEGNFAFEFTMPVWAETGTYTVKCGGDASNSPAILTFKYEEVTEEPEKYIDISTAIIDSDGNISVLGTSSGISGQITLSVKY